MGTFFVLNFALDVVDGIKGLNLQGDGLPREGFDENLHDVRTVALAKTIVYRALV
jgi:hypothetical protein